MMLCVSLWMNDGIAAYFTDELPKMPYVENPCDVRCVSFSPNGTILGGNVYQSDIYEDHKGDQK